MKTKLIKAINLYLSLLKSERPDAEMATHTSFHGFGAYLSSDSYDEEFNRLKEDYERYYAEFKFAGIALNLNGQLNIQYEDLGFFALDFNKWITTAIGLLETKNWEESSKITLKDFLLPDSREIMQEVKVQDLFADEYRVKAKLFDKLMDRNINFTNLAK